MFESPIQIVIVLIIALIVFGPKRLPELGKQLGSALRELNKAKNDMMRSINLDHEPDPEPYNYSYPTDYQTTYAGAIEPYTPPTDLTDYTIAGQPAREHAPEGTVARSDTMEPSHQEGEHHV